MSSTNDTARDVIVSRLVNSEHIDSSAEGFEYEELQTADAILAALREAGIQFAGPGQIVLNLGDAEVAWDIANRALIRKGIEPLDPLPGTTQEGQ